MNSQRQKELGRKLFGDKVTLFGSILLAGIFCIIASSAIGQTSPPAAYPSTQPAQPSTAVQPTPTQPTPTSAQPAAAPSAQPAPPPSAAPQRSAAELEQLVGPIALYPDPLLAVMLPAACYPLEIVEAARFVADTNNVPMIDSQNWDENVKAVAKVPSALAKMNDDLRWTSDLGQAFLDQQKDVMDAIQAMRNKATTAGTLQTSPQQNVIVTNNIALQTNGTQVVYVTNQIVQIEPSNPEVIYVPQYVPSAVYYPPPTYVANPVAPLVTFGVGMAVGAAIHNDCDWHGGGIYVGGPGWHGGHYSGDVNVNRNVNVNQNINVNRNAAATANRTEWKPDSTRLRSSGAPGAAANYQAAEARGWGGGAGAQQAANNAAARQPAANRQNVTPQANRPNYAQQRPNAPAASRPAPQATRPAQQAARPAPQQQAARPAQQQVSRPAPQQQASRPAPSSGQSAFSGVNNGAGAQYASQRGAASRGGGAYGGTGHGAARGGGGGGGGRRR